MTYEAYRGAGITEKLFFEGQHHRKMIRIACELLHPAAVPRPNLRRNVVEHGRPALPCISREPQIEAGVIDGNDEIGRCGLDVRFHAPEQPQKIRKMFCDFEKAHY